MPAFALGTSWGASSNGAKRRGGAPAENRRRATFACIIVFIGLSSFFWRESLRVEDELSQNLWGSGRVEVGYLTLETAQASLLFQTICERYEKQQAVVLTSNKAFTDWGQVFAGDAIMASAALDRLLHRCTVINIRGDSYRLKEKRQAKAAQEVIAEN